MIKKLMPLAFSLLLPVSVLAQDAPPAEAAPTEAAPVEAAPDPAAQKQAQIDAMLQEVDALYAQRAQAGKAEAVIAKMQELLKLDDKSYEAQWRIARAAYWIGDGTEDKKVKEKYGKIGWDAGIAGTALKPNGIEAQFWGAASLGNYAKGVGIMKAVWDGLGKQYEKWARKAYEMNPKYAWGGPPRALGRYYFTLPGIAGRDIKKSIKYLEESRDLAPEALRTRAWLAESYLEDDQKAKAKAELDYCVAADPKNGDYADNLRMQPECKRLAGTL